MMFALKPPFIEEFPLPYRKKCDDINKPELNKHHIIKLWTYTRSHDDNNSNTSKLDKISGLHTKRTSPPGPLWVAFGTKWPSKGDCSACASTSRDPAGSCRGSDMGRVWQHPVAAWSDSRSRKWLSKILLGGFSASLCHRGTSSHFYISMVEHQSISGGNYHFNIFHSSTSGLQPSTQSAVQLHRVPNNFTQDLAGTRKGMKNVYQQCLSILFIHKFYLRLWSVKLLNILWNSNHNIYYVHMYIYIYICMLQYCIYIYILYIFKWF